jgi:hypothetical protein
LEKHDLVVWADGEEFPQARDGFLEDPVEGGAAVADLKYIPTPGRASISSRACSSTGRGSTAGPGEKLKTRSVIGGYRNPEILPAG